MDNNATFIALSGKGAAHKVSNKLPKAEELSLIMGEYFKIDTIISDSQMYQVSGIKNR